MTTPKIGETSTNNDLLGRRDAYHLPGIFVCSYDSMNPGDSVVFTDRELTRVRRCDEGENRNAVVDPFLTEPTNGAGFHVLLVPGSTSNLTHQFTVDLGSGQEFYRPDGESMADDDDNCRGCY